MHWLSRLRRRLRLVFHRSDVEREMADEMHFHLEMEADELDACNGDVTSLSTANAVVVT